METNLITNDKRVMQYIKANPGCSLKEVARYYQMSFWELLMTLAKIETSERKVLYYLRANPGISLFELKKLTRLEFWHLLATLARLEEEQKLVCNQMSGAEPLFFMTRLNLELERENKFGLKRLFGARASTLLG
jgi:predicted transcriptional regulator